MPGPDHLLELGAEAAAAGRWDEAEAAFAAAAGDDPSPEALLGLGTCRWWLGQTRSAMADLEAAYAGFVGRADAAGAAGVAVHLSLLHQANYGNRAASSGWAGRAARWAAAAAGPTTLGAWALLARAVTCPQPDRAEQLARQALDAGIGAADRDLELCALSQLGAVLADGGRVEAGTQLLDEALAGALGGEAATLDTVVFTSCQLMRTCVRAADFPRVLHWWQPLADFTDRYGCPYVFATCRTQFGAVLFATGDWTRADAELRTALDMCGDALPAVRAEASGHLADLRLAQGRIEEAMALVVDYPDQPVPVATLAAAQLAAGQRALAASTARRRLAAGTTGVVEESRLREVLGEAQLAGDDAEAAAEEGRTLLEAGPVPPCDLVAARGRRLLGRGLAGSEPVGARGHLDRALAAFSRLQMPLEVARCRLALAGALVTEEPEAAVEEARAAHRTFAALGARTDADLAAAWLRAARSPVAAGPVGGASALTRREGEVAVEVGRGLSNPEIAERLYISRRTVEHHVASILSKLALRNRTEIAAWLARRGGQWGAEMGDPTDAAPGPGPEHGG